MSKAQKIFSLFARDLGRMREEQGVTREQIAVMASVSYSTVRRFEEGESDSLLVLAAEINAIEWPGKWKALEQLFEQMAK